MRLIFSGLITSLFFLFLTFLIPNQVNAVSVCGGTINCYDLVTSCQTSGGVPCACGSLGCNLYQQCDGANVSNEPCSSFNSSQCTDSGFWVTYCDVGCPAGTGRLVGASCNWQADACIGAGDCPQYPNQTCCGGTPNYCSTPGFDCAGNLLATPTPTPTPASGCAATWFGTQATCASWCIANQPGATGCSADCSVCTYPGATATPTAAPTPTTGSGGGGTGFACANSSGTPWTACQTAGTCETVCIAGGWAGCVSCDMPPDGGGSSCMENGGSCYLGDGSGCCSGYCSPGNTCESVPTCSGCTSWNGSYCQDNNFLCGGGQTCSGGVCVDPTYTISGKVFVDANGNGVQNCSGSCDNGAGDELNYQGATVTRNPSGQTSTTNSSGNYSFTNLSAFIYTISLTLPSGYTATTANPVNRTVGPSQTANFGIVQSPADCPTEITASTNTVDSGGTVNLSMSGCAGVEDPPDGSSPPPFDWDPPQDDNPGDEGDPQCSDGVDNDGDGLIDTNDPGCHWDGDSTNPGSYRPNDDNEANVSGPRQCNDGIDNDSDGFVDLADPGCNNSSDDNESDRLSPGKSGSTTCSDSELAVISTTSTSSTATWTAPACATSQLVCTITGVVNGPGGTDTYIENITVNQTGVINVDVRDVSDGQPCDASAPLYTGSTTLGLSGAVTTTETITDGTYSFACLPNGNYTVSLGLPAGYQIFTGGTSQATSITDGIKTRDIRFCIANFEPWYQTTQGDVRMRGIVNPIPAGLVGSTDATSPSVFFSTQYSAEVDAGGGLSAKNWLVNREYDYNSLTRNRNGVVAHSFYKSRARQEGIPITQLTSGTLDNNNTEVLENGVYEWTGDMVIDGYSQVAERAVILVDGNVTISSEVAIPLGSLFIVAASGDITVASTVGHASPNFNTTASNLDGIYSAEGNIILAGSECAGGVPDRRLNIAGALIANAQKPFASTGGGAVQNQRSLCTNDDLYPSLYVSSRPDFLTKLTDFYKVSYTKWREVRP